MTMNLTENIVILAAAALTATPAYLSLAMNMYNKRKIKKVANHVSQIHLLINSRLSELLELNKHASYAEGQLAGPTKPAASPAVKA
jgi:hypothetical protein